MTPARQDGPAVDQTARDMAQQAINEHRAHSDLCGERYKSIGRSLDSLRETQGTIISRLDNSDRRWLRIAVWALVALVTGMGGIAAGSFWLGSEMSGFRKEIDTLKERVVPWWKQDEGANRSR